MRASGGATVTTISARRAEPQDQRGPQVARGAAVATLSALQADLFGHGRPQIDENAVLERLRLDEHSWIDTSSRWLRGGDDLLERLVSSLRWTRAQRPMYGRMITEPRLGALVKAGSRSAPAPLDAMASALGRRYGVSFTAMWVNYYRDGADSVAWHGDRIGLNPADAIVAIVSLGGPRRFLLRRRGGGASRPFTLASGDLLVMGGACQRDWEHCIPKAASASPRMSVTLRHSAR